MAVTGQRNSKKRMTVRRMPYSPRGLGVVCHVAETIRTTLEKSVVGGGIVVKRAAQQGFVQAVQAPHVAAHQVADFLFGDDVVDGEFGHVIRSACHLKYPYTIEP